ncbi:hypothetical protein GQR58_007406 [Nymphon striatum]|nr:hypothetical protein GQR58_007406 [Nymphon striatum]
MLALASAFLISLYKVLARLITKTHYRVICLYETWMHIVLFTIVVLAMGIVEMPTNLLDWLLPMSVGVTYMVCIVCYTTGFRYTDAAYAGFASMSFLPTSIILKCTIEKTLPNMYDFIGMACIIMSVVISLFAITFIELILFIPAPRFKSAQQNLLSVIMEWWTAAICTSMTFYIFFIAEVTFLDKNIEKLILNVTKHSRYSESNYVIFSTHTFSSIDHHRHHRISTAYFPTVPFFHPFFSFPEFKTHSRLSPNVTRAWSETFKTVPECNSGRTFLLCRRQETPN